MIMKIFLLVFVWTSRLNSKPILSGDRTTGNHVNGVIAVSMLQLSLLNAFYILYIHIMSLRYDIPPIFGLLLYLIIVVINGWWLIYKRAGIEYISAYKKEAKSARNVLTICTLVTIFIGVSGLFVP